MRLPQDIKDRMRERGICVLMPTYNNAATLGGVIEDVLEYCDDVIVVNDGSTDSTADVLKGFGDKITVVSYSDNKGKGFALRRGFASAWDSGFKYALTIDSDGQHYADDIPVFVEAETMAPGAMIIGSRGLRHDNMPAGNTFANKFSNFWFAVQTGRRLPDTQTGYRLYPLRQAANMKFATPRYEAELEMMVRMAWRGIKIVPVEIKVFYAPAGERVTHFRKGADFGRITALNTFLCVMAVCWGYPSMGVRAVARSFRKR